MSNLLTVMESVVEHVQYIATLDVAMPTMLRRNDMVATTISVTEVIKSILNIYAYRKALGDRHKSVSWLQGYLVCIILSTGGASTVALIRGEPLSLLYKNDIWIINGLIYWCIFSNDYIFRLLQWLLETFPLLNIICHFIGAVSRGFGIVRLGVDGGFVGSRERTLNGNSTKPPAIEGLIGQLLCGTLVGCATGFWIELFDLLQPVWRISMPKYFLEPSTTVKISLWTSLLYSMLLKPFYVEDLAVARTISALFFAVLLCHDRITSVSIKKKVTSQRASSAKKARLKRK